jgi:hypothetical protein
VSISNPRSGRRPHGWLYNSILTERFRATLALSLVIALSLGFFNLSALAAPRQEQAEDGSNPKSRSLYEIENEGPGFIVNQMNGVTVCRDATPEELLRINQRDPNQKLRPINHPELFRGLSKDGAGSSDAPDLGTQSMNAEGQESETATSPQAALQPSAGLRIILRGTDQLKANQAAVDAFNKAANNWEAIIITPITIVIDVDYGTTRFGQPWDSDKTLGSTSGGGSPVLSYSGLRSRLVSGQSNADETALYAKLPPSSAGLPTDLSTANVTDMVVSTPIARALTLLPQDAQTDTTSSTPSIGFNSNFIFDLDPSDGVNSGQTDFDSVATHEIGHVLGFTSSEGRGQVTLTSSNGTSRQAYIASPWDVFRFKQTAGAALSNFDTLARTLTVGAGNTDLQLAFYGPNAPQPQLSTGGPDGSAGDQHQSSHWRADDRLAPGQPLNTYWGIMDPTIGRGQRYFITDNDKRALDFMGYRVVGISTTIPAPANNNLANAQTITGCSGSVNGTNAGANKETGEPSHDSAAVPNAGGASVWYQWTAPSSGLVTITTQGSDFDTMLGVYIGNAVGSLTTVAKNDDVDGNTNTSTVTFSASANMTFKIAVDGFSGQTGNIKLNWSAANCGVTPTPTPTPTPPVITGISIRSTTYSVSEGDATGVVTLIVDRGGNDLSGSASVDYKTSDNSTSTPCQTNTNGSASDRCDYATAVGTVRFAAGETTKTIQIPIVNDSYVEPSETFTVTLQNYKGVTMPGIAPPTTVTILDNDGQTATTNPINSQDFFIKQQYIDFLGRVAEPAGFAFWMDRMTNCPAGQVCDRIDTSQRFFQSDEFQERGFYVYKLYDAVLGRLPRYAEFVPDVARLNGSQTPAEQRLGKDAYLLDLINKQEFRGIYGIYLTPDGLTAANPTGFVNELCSRSGITPASRQTLINNLQSGARTPAQTLEDFILTPEISGVGTKFYDRAIITMQYFGYLRRDPETAGFNFWWDRLANPQSTVYHNYREIVGNFLTADEYYFRFAFTH